jgi:hypothetical protein
MSEFDAAKDYYEILGARQDASRDEIERLYKRLAVQHHPDRGGDEERMKSLNEAYRVLGNEASRVAYDAERRPPAREAPPVSSPSAQADALWGRVAGALLCLGAGLALLLLVCAHWIWFLWPLGVLAAAVIGFGVLMAHAAMLYFRDSLAATHPARRYFWVQETIFWCAVVVAIYVIYMALTIV